MSKFYNFILAVSLFSLTFTCYAGKCVGVFVNKGNYGILYARNGHTVRIPETDKLKNMEEKEVMVYGKAGLQWMGGRLQKTLTVTKVLPVLTGKVSISGGKVFIKTGSGNCELSPGKGSNYLSRKCVGRIVKIAGNWTSPETEGKSSRLFSPTSMIAVQNSRGFSGNGGKRFAGTARKLPEEKLKPGEEITLKLPELGNSAASGGRSPIAMTVKLPSNYVRTEKHPVIMHFGGGRGKSSAAKGWGRVTGDKDFILVGADYSFTENERAGLLKYGTCRDFDSKIAAHALQILSNSTAIDKNTIILAGMSSGAYSITDNLNSVRTMKIFTGFCAISGGSRPKKGAVHPQMRNKPIMFIMGSKDNQKFSSHGNQSRIDWLNEAVAALKAKGCSKVKVVMEPGVGHSWSSNSYPKQKEWLYSEFSVSKKQNKLFEAAKNCKNPKMKKFYDQWINEQSMGM